MQQIERVPIAAIRVRERRRIELGDIPALARNIDEHGLLNPIIIAADNELIAGERRLRAFQLLGLTEIEVRRWPDLTDDERREIELAENLNRKNLTPSERSRQMVALAEVATEIVVKDFSAKSAEKSNGRGRPPKPDAERRVAERMGVPERTLNKAKRHVAAAD